MSDACSKKHIILVHGACHGAWSWHKLTTLLISAGHRVTVPDLAASGVDDRRFPDLRNFADYTQPLLDLLRSLPPDERVILVGHSLGGHNIALAMNKFPEKIAAGVFLSAFMPDSVNPPAHVYSKLIEIVGESTTSYWLDTEFGTVGDKEKGPLSMLFGPKFMAKLYRLSPPEDLTLAMSLLRPASLFMEELSSAPPLSKSGYESVKKVYIVCAKDEVIIESYQRWMIENTPVTEVKEMKDADHMPMLSTPKQLCQCIMDIADKYI
ncbi:salicylic acid-binding protein 2-like [Canna indica]|uniref:Salicylic acid-binding protein 2-like n=1 Tax=Canna indica TaxID=4628 RepID=A0AAQ3KY95_9LILI|nr:salicylic acid-binding protein 2-like [Canna indica]